MDRAAAAPVPCIRVDQHGPRASSAGPKPTSVLGAWLSDLGAANLVATESHVRRAVASFATAVNIGYAAVAARVFAGALPEDHSETIAAILQKEPMAARWRVGTELRRIYGVDISDKRLRTYLASLGDRPTIADEPAAKRRRVFKDDEDGGLWLSANEARVRDLLTTLGDCGDMTLQRTIQTHFGVCIGRHPLRGFLVRFYATTGASPPSIHDDVERVAGATAIAEEVEAARPIYADLRKLFSDTPMAVSDLVGLLLQFSISMSSRAATELFCRLLLWDIEVDNEFSMATGMDTAQRIQFWACRVWVLRTVCPLPPGLFLFSSFSLSLFSFSLSLSLFHKDTL